MMEATTAYHPSQLGWLKIQAVEDRLTAVTFSEEAPAETRSVEHPVIRQCIDQLTAYFAGGLSTFDLPMEQTGTEFQQKVWKLLQEIPFGRTLSYQTLAQQYGDLKAIRAVAAANGKNNLAILVPCHRVIGSNHSLTGYAGGLWRKKWLLEHEAKWHRGVSQSQLF